MTFSTALEELKQGHYLIREGWNGKHSIRMNFVTKYDDYMEANYIYIKPENSPAIPWVASQSDLLAEDWRLWTKEDYEGGE